MVKEPIYMTIEGKKQLEERLKRLKEKYNQNNTGRREAFDASAGDGWDTPEYEEIQRKEYAIIGEIESLSEQLSRVVIIENHNENDLVDLGDIVSLDMIFDDEIEKYVVKLVGTQVDMNASVEEVSVGSPLGKAIYKSKLGQEATYSVNGNIFKIKISEIKKNQELEQGMQNG